MGWRHRAEYRLGRVSGWAERAAAALLPLSNATTLAAALREWEYRGIFYDSEDVREVCELCGQQDLRYQFKIHNDETASTLLVGSECIKRFAIVGVDSEGRQLDSAATGRLVDRDRRGLVENARKKRVMIALLLLGQKDPSVEASSFIDFVDDRGAFTPNQVSFIFWRLDTARVEYRPTDWKVRLRRDSDYSQMRNMNPAAYRRVTAALSPAQRQRIAKIEANFAQHGQRWRDLN